MNAVTTPRREHAGPSGRKHARRPGQPRPRVARKPERLHTLGAFVLLLLIVVGVPTVLVLLVGSPVPTSWVPANELTITTDATTVMAALSVVLWLAWAHFVVCVVVEWRSGRGGPDVTPRIPIGGGPQTLARSLVTATVLFSGTAILLTPAVDGSGHRPAITTSTTGTAADDAPRPATVGADAYDVRAVPPSSTETVSGQVHAADIPYRGLTGPALLAAGMVVALSRRRPRSSDGDPVDDVETALRLAADVEAARFVDQTLRALSGELTAAGRSLPAVYAATLTDSAFHLHMAPAESEGPPAPWRVGEIPNLWCVDRVAGTSDGPPVGIGSGVSTSTPAPYPGLATIGRDDAGATVLIDVEGAPGIISLGGDPAIAREVAVSIAVELATNLWSDDLRVCMIGFSDDLIAIAPDRLRTSASLAEVLDEVEDRERRRGDVVRGGLIGGVGAVLRGRQAAYSQALWAPDLLVLSAPPTDDEAARLAAFVGGRDCGVGIITVGDTTTARWRFVVRPDRRLSLGVLGLDVIAQTLSVHEYSAIVKLFQQAEVTEVTGPPRENRPAGAVAPAPTPTPTPWVPEIPPWMRPPAVSTASASVRPDHPALPPVPRFPPPRTRPLSQPAHPAAITPATTRPPRPPAPSGKADSTTSPSAGSPSAGSQTIPTTGEPAFPPPRSFPNRIEPASPPPDTPPPPPTMVTASSLSVPPMASPQPLLLAGTASGNDTLPRSGSPGIPPRSASTTPTSVLPPPVAVQTLPHAPIPRPVALPPVSVDLCQPANAEIRVLGTITVDAPGPLDSGRQDLLTELVVYLALHRGGVHPDALTTAIWPDGVSDNVVAATLDHARDWLGPDSVGNPRLTADDKGYWELADDIRCDWDLFVGYTNRSTQPNADTEGDLTTALQLVTGPVWTNLPEGRYRWLASSPIETTTSAAVVDMAHRLAMLTLGYGDTLTAVAACRTGLRAVPTAEILWRDLLRTVAARGDRKALDAVVSEMYRVIAPPRTGRQAEAETNLLVKKLLPGFRRR